MDFSIFGKISFPPKPISSNFVGNEFSQFMNTILLTGASGLVGKPLKQKLEQNNYRVRTLSRKKTAGTFFWNPSENYIDERALEGVDAIIHLAGAPIAKKWTRIYKKELYSSRISTANLLFNSAVKIGAKPKIVLTASGTNFYGTNTTNKIYVETDMPGTGFLSNLCLEWERSATKFKELGARVCSLRTAAVLSASGGILQRLVPLFKLHLGSVIGSGKQILPWVHVDDLVNGYLFLLQQNQLEGAFNLAAPDEIDNKEFTKTLARVLDKRQFLPAIPACLLKINFGEMASILLEGSAVSPNKLIKAGFRFQFRELEPALHTILHSLPRSN